MKISLNKYVEITYHFINDYTVFIDLFYIDIKEQNNGLGRKSIQYFINTLPREVTEIRLVAATNLTGRVNLFWEKMGFQYLYDIQDESFEEDILYAMTKPVNGGNLKKLIYRESLDDEFY
jgi:hypothetical protein